MKKLVFKRCTITLDATTIRKCKELAVAKGQSVSSLIRYIVSETYDHVMSEDKTLAK